MELYDSSTSGTSAKQSFYLLLSPKNLRAVQLLPGQTKLESAVRYLGIAGDDALEIAASTEVGSRQMAFWKQTRSPDGKRTRLQIHDRVKEDNQIRIVRQLMIWSCIFR
jgi:hypothetical protein